MTRISIITPCLNAERYIEETVVSVINQKAIKSGRAELEYIICDGQSTDRTLKIIESLKCNAMTLISEPDRSMYDALAKGLKYVTGDIISYVNAGDYFNLSAFEVVLDIFETGKACWLTGCNVVYNERSQPVYFHLPYKYRSSFFACGYYGTKLPCVQQESTFWSGLLNKLIDLNYLSNLKYAGDFYIWLQFSRSHDLKIVESYLGGFRKSKGQLSENRVGYLSEVKLMTRSPRMHESMLVVFDYILWHAPVKVKKFFNKHGLYRFDHELQEWV